MAVQMIKIPALTGHTVKIMGTRVGRRGVRPMTFRVDRVTDSSVPEHVGHYWFLWGERVYASGPRAGQPCKIRANDAQWVAPRDVLAIVR